jgi:hypothetical protein
MENKMIKSKLNKKTMYSILTVLVCICAYFFSSIFTKNILQYDFTKYEQFKSVEGSFSVLFPNKVSETKETVNTAAGPILMHQFESKAKYHEFIVVYSDYPEGILKVSNSDKILNGARDGSIKNIQGTLLSETFITLNGYPGRELRIEGPQKIILESRIILANQRLYQIIAVCQPEHSFDSIVSKVLKSLEITKNTV